MRKTAQPDEAADGDISVLLSARKNGDRRALEKPTPMVYTELHQLARRYMRRERPGHIFGGLTVEETAEVLKVSPVTVMRDWSTAKAWLYRELTAEPDDGLRTLQTSR